MGEPEGFREFVDGRSRDLLRSAWLLTGDWHAAEDLVQTALVKTWPRWNRIARADTPAVYVRRVMLTTFLADRKRRWTGEVATAVLPETLNETQDVDLRWTLFAAIRTLPPRQRAALVLRYFEDLTEADTAQAMGCSIGTVKTHASRGLAHLRGVPELADLATEAAR